MRAKRSRVVTRREFQRASALAGPSPRGDLSGSLATRFVSLQALIPLPRSTILR